MIAQTPYGQFFSQRKDVISYKGYFNFYYHTTTDKLYLEVAKLNTEFLYVHSLSEGVGDNDIGLDRGKLGEGSIVMFKKAGNKLLLIQPNQHYRAITPNTAERKAVKEAFAKSVIYGFTIKEEKDSLYLVDATSFLIRDAHGVARTLAQRKQGTYRLDAQRSAFHIARTKAFPKNVEFDVMLTFEGESSGESIRSVTPDASSVTVHQHHSFVALPDQGYSPRVFDPRSGSYMMSYLDYATPVNESIVKRYIHRHRLEKKDPSAAFSQAKSPIIYYLDNATPEPVRSALLEGAQWWNQAFEAIGYKDAFQVKMLPEDADPMDIRYNVIQWVHRSTRGWSYGNTISDPRTGEILKGHVSLGSLRIRQDFMLAQALQAPYRNNDTDDEFAVAMALARIKQLAAHEVGHTLGFAHNFAASTNGRSSVMDYPHPKLRHTPQGIDFSEAYATGIGAWDKVTVAYSYQDFPDGDHAETEGLRKILDNAFTNGLRYISDADARPKGGAHAYAHLWDNGTDPVAELENVLTIRKAAIAAFSVDQIKSEQPYSVLEDVFVPLYFFHRYQAEAVAKLIGGMDYSYAVKGTKSTIVEPIAPSIQRDALKGLLKTISVETVRIPPRILALFPPRATGYNRTRESFKSKLNVAFDALGAAETATHMVMALLLHPERASRIVQDQALAVDQWGLDEIIDTIIAHTFKQQQDSGYNTALQNTINFVVLTYLIDLAVSPGAYKQVNAIAAYKLNKLEKWLQKKKTKGIQRMYDQQMLKTIADFKEHPERFERIKVPEIPDGAPIGME